MYQPIAPDSRATLSANILITAHFANMGHGHYMAFTVRPFDISHRSAAALIADSASDGRYVSDDMNEARYTGHHSADPISG